MRRIGVLLLVALSFVGLGVSESPAYAGPAISGRAAIRQLLYPGTSFYPRMIRLQHSGAANGVIVASVNTVQQTGVILASTDGGKTFQQRATITDTATAHGGLLCCSTLYELPTAVGVMPAGTLLWADTVHFDAVVVRHVEQRLWASADHGFHWQFVSSIAAANSLYSFTQWGPPLPSAWEPSLSMSGDGQLVAFYSDETDNLSHSQKLVQVRSPDGVHWVDQADTVVSDVGSVRPGMANVIRLPDSSYFMTYEVCNSDQVHQCLVYFRRSSDGWNFGDPRYFGTAVRTADYDGYTQHSPYPVWSPGPGPHGTILLAGQMISNEDGHLSPEAGKTILANDAIGEGKWYTVRAPVAVKDVEDGFCTNYSSALLPSVDGRSVIEAATDLDNGVCRSYFASGPLRASGR